MRVRPELQVASRAALDHAMTRRRRTPRRDLYGVLPLEPRVLLTAFTNPTLISVTDRASGVGSPLGVAVPYPAGIVVSGLVGSLQDVNVTLLGLTATRPRDLDVLLVAPNGAKMLIMSDAGGLNAVSGINVTIDDQAATIMPGDAVELTAGTLATASYRATNGTGSPPEADTFPGPAPAGPYSLPGPGGISSLNSVFSGNPNGTWNLFVVDDSLGGGTHAINGGWRIDIATGSAAVSTTTLTANVSQSFTAAPSHQVTLTASVSSTSAVNEGGVTFLDTTTGTTLASNVPVVAGQASVANVVFSVEGDHLIQATYNGSANFALSTATRTQRVDNHTVVTGARFANSLTGITFNDNDAIKNGKAGPYPSRVFVSGVNGVIADVNVALNGISVSRPRDMDLLLVAPNGQSLILLSDVADLTATSGVNLILDDAAASPLPSGSGTVLASGTFRPTNIVGSAPEPDVWPAPAPVPSAATALTAFNGLDPNGTWSLYVYDDSLGGAAGVISGGWSLSFATIGPPSSPDLQAPSDSGASNIDNLTNAANLVFDVSAAQAGATVELLRGGTVVASRTGAGALADTAPPAGVHIYTTRQTINGTTVAALAPLNVTIDRTGPVLTSAAAFEFETSQRVRYLFGENVSATFASIDVVVVTRPANVAIADASKVVAPIGGTNGFTVTFASTLADGNYRATLTQAGITDVAGNPLTTSSTLDFFVLAGDADHDRDADFDDLLVLARNYSTLGRTFSQGNFNYSAGGSVDFDDLLILARRYGTTLPAAAPLAVTLTPTRRRFAESVIG